MIDISIEELEAMEADAMQDFSVSDEVRASVVAYNAKKAEIIQAIELGDVDYIQAELDSKELDDLIVNDPSKILCGCIDHDRFGVFALLMKEFEDVICGVQIIDRLLYSAIAYKKDNDQFVKFLMDHPDSNPLSDTVLRSLVIRGWGNARLIDGAVDVIDMIIRHPKVSSLDIADLKRRLEVDLYASNVAEDGKGEINDALQMIKVKMLEEAWDILDE